jgi:hypothetical protein
MRRKVLLCALSCGLAIYLPQLASAAEPWRFSLRRSLVDKNQISKPASLQFTIPDEGESSYSADLGVSLSRSFLGSSLWSFALGGEYHRNNQSDEEQDTLIGSLALLGQVGELGGGSEVAWFPGASVSFKRDGVKGTKSVVPAVDLTLAGSALRVGSVLGPENFGFLWQPKVGFEYEDVISAENDGPTGHVGRAFLQVELGIYPGFKALGARLEVVPSFKVWDDVVESKALDSGKDRHQLKKVDVNYFLDTAKQVAIGYSLVDGEDPSEGLPDQKYQQIALKVKLDFPR